MLPTIHLDNNPSVAANKVYHIGSDRLLAYEFEAAKSPVTDREPEFHFGIGSIASKAANLSHGFPVGTTHRLPLTRLAPSALGTLSPLRGARVGSMPHAKRTTSTQNCTFTASSMSPRRGR